MEIGTLKKSSVMSQFTLHTEAVVCRESNMARPRPCFPCRNPALGEGFQCKQKRRKGWSSLKVQAVDAAQAFDFETKQLEKLQAQNKLRIGLVGFGNYGQFLAKKLVKQGHTVLAYSRSDYSELARKMNVQYFRDADDFCEERPEVIVLCTSILSTEAVLRALPVQRLRRSTLFVDVLSVKEFPKNLLLQVLPEDFDVLCTHPMFGPQSGKDSWSGLPFVYDKIRVGRGSREKRCEKFLNIFSSEGCRMVEMSCEEHDRHAASSQFITHTVGRVLGKLGLHWTPINTKGYETLLDLVNNTGGDSFDLYYGLFMYNINATEELDRLELAFDSVKKQLFSQLHNVLRSQLFDHHDAEEEILFPSARADNTQRASVDRHNAEEAIPSPSARPDNTQPVSDQSAKLKEATNKLDTVMGSGRESNSARGELQHH